MKTLIITSGRIIEEEGKYYIDNGLNAIVQRYREYFGEISLFGMDGSDKGKRSKSAVEINNVNVRILGTRNDLYMGKAKKTLNSEIPNYDLIILRIPSVVCNQATGICKKHHVPYFAEIIGDTFGILWYHSIPGKILAIPSLLRTKKTVRNADFALYVSKFFLQKIYPCKNKSVGISDCVIDMPTEELINKRLRRIEDQDYKMLTIVNAAAIDVKYKGQEYVVRAIPLINKAGIRVKFFAVGNGNKEYLLNIARKYKVEDQVVFTGSVSHDEVIQMLDNADFYIQPSLTEGFGRSVVEALSRGCICIGSNVGGITELVPKDYLVKPKSENEIFDRINRFLALDVEEKKKLCINNFNHSKNYDPDRLNQEREAYYQEIIETISLKGK